MELSGTLISLRVFNGWAIGSVRVDDGALIQVVGNALVGLSEGTRYAMRGAARVHPRYGEQVDVTSALPDVQVAAGPLKRFMADNFKGCGPKTATAVIEWFQANDGLDALRELLVERPWQLIDAPALAGRKIEMLEETATVMETRIYRKLAVCLSGHGIPDGVLRRLGARLHAESAKASDPPAAAWASLATDPYAAIPYVDGYGFAFADTIGREMKIPVDAPCRLAALVYHVLRKGCEENGHTFLPIPVLRAGFEQMAPGLSLKTAVRSAVEAGIKLVREGDRIYLGYLHYAEKLVKHRTSLMVENNATSIYLGSDFELKSSIELAEFSMGQSFALDDTQRAALMGLLRSRKRLHTLTAGPGCGKTAIMEVLVQVATRHNILFAAPTGKAAKVLASRVGRFGCIARTIHSLLEPSSDGGFSFQKNEENPLAARVLVLDESSMIDLPLLAAVLRALPEDAHLILLGDPDQLPSIGAGVVLDDILRMPADHHRLSVTHRNRGAILDTVRAVSLGSFPKTGGADVDLAGDVGDPAEDAERVIGLYVEAVKSVGAAKVGFLIPRRKGRIDEPGWNITYMNARLQAVMNPDGEKVAGSLLRLGDRIIVRRNVLIDAEAEGDEPEYLVNGDTGVLRFVVRDNKGSIKGIHLALDDGRDITLPGEYLEIIGLAYTTTVHAAQGSEYRRVILVVNAGAPGFMNRKILYTAISRAKEHLTVLGAPHVLAQVAARPAPMRFSNLVDTANDND